MKKKSLYLLLTKNENKENLKICSNQEYYSLINIPFNYSNSGHKFSICLENNDAWCSFQKLESNYYIGYCVYYEDLNGIYWAHVYEDEIKHYFKEFNDDDFIIYFGSIYDHTD